MQNLKFFDLFTLDLRQRRKLIDLVQQPEPTADQNCPFDRLPEDFILPENSIKSFKGPFKLTLFDSLLDFKADQKYNCRYRYEYFGTRSWDQIIDTPGHKGYGQGLFSYNVRNREYGPLFFNSAMYMPLNQPLKPVEGQVSSNYKKTKNFTVLSVKNNNVIRKPMSFLAIKEAIPYFSVLSFTKESQDYKMNVRKSVDASADQITLFFGTVSSLDARYKKFAIASQCLELNIDNKVKVMKINLIQNIPSFNQYDYNGVRDIDVEQKELLCAYKPSGQKEKLLAKDLIEITFQMALHIGNIFAIGLEDQMHFEFEDAEFKKNSTIYINRNIRTNQYISISVITLGTLGYTKYEQYIADLRPSFKFSSNPQKKIEPRSTRLLHPIAYRYWASRLPNLKVKDMEKGIIKDSLYCLFNGVCELRGVKTPRGNDIVKKLFEKKGTLNEETKFKEIFETIVSSPERIKKVILLIELFVDPSSNEILKKYLLGTLFKNHDVRDTELVTYYMIAILKSVKYTSDDIIKSGIHLRIQQDLMQKFGPYLSSDKDVPDKLKDFVGSPEFVTEQAIIDFVPYKAEYYTNNFLNKSSDLEITKWETDYSVTVDTLREL